MSEIQNQAGNRCVCVCVVCGVVWCGVCGVVCVVWCGVVWCGVCGVCVWCGVVCVRASKCSFSACAFSESGLFLELTLRGHNLCVELPISKLKESFSSSLAVLQ